MSTHGHWAPYTPDAKAPWDLRRVVFLRRRAALAGTWTEIQRDLKEGPDASIDRLLTGAATTAPTEFASIADLLADSAVAAADLGRLKAWWFYRILFGPDPLGEKLTLFWHDHFATANSKVQDAALMRRQNDALRKNARAKFAELLDASVREPALLFYLDAPANRKGHANENLARELMELFTLGVGHFSESDVKEAARALTGWSVADRQFVEVVDRHDEDNKTVLGKTGRWTGTDLVSILLGQPATAHRIATKLCRLFCGETNLPPEAVQALAIELREHDLDIGHAVGVVVRSQRFLWDVTPQRVVSPVEFIAGAARALELFDPAPSTLALADWSARMGQDLFEPPNVGGWPGGRAWIHTRSLVARTNYAAAIVNGPSAGRPSPYDATALPAKYGFGTSAEDVLVFHHRLLFGTDPSAAVRRGIDGLEGGKIVTALLSSPEAQIA